MGLKIGDEIPNFKTKDTNGDNFDSKDFLGHKPLVIYFYPKDHTPGCIVEACSFRDQYEDFTALGAEVIGISSDNEASHQSFAQKYKLPFILLSDKAKSIQKLFGVPTKLFGLLPGRVTYIIDKNGIIKMIFDSVMPKNHISKAIEVIKELNNEE